MSYVTQAEFEDLIGLKAVDNAQFSRFSRKAEAVLDNVTNNYFRHYVLSEAPDYLAKPFKLAVCAQISYFMELGGDTFEGINKSPQTVNIGATSVSNGSRYNASGANESKSLLAEDIYIYLEGTGLLYRGGVSSC